MTSTSRNAYPREGLTAKPILRVAIAFAGLAAFASPALANGMASQSVDLMIDVEASCKMDPFTTQLIEIPAPDGIPSTDPETTTTTVNCNTPSAVKIISTSGGAINATGGTPLDNSAYINAFDYTASVATGGTTLVTLDTADPTPSTGAPEETSAVSAFDTMTTEPDAPLTLTIEAKSLPQGKILQAGTYGDTLTVQISPQ